MSRSPEEIREQYKEMIKEIHYQYDEKRDNLALAERIDVYLSLLAEVENLDVSWSVVAHYINGDGREISDILLDR